MAPKPDHQHPKKPHEEHNTCVIHDLFSKGSETTLDNCECSIACNCPFSCNVA